MYLIELTYQAPLSEIEKYLQAHREHLDYYYKQGRLLLSGPLNPRTGGIILAVKMPLSELEAIFNNDPFCMTGLASYQISEFTPVKHCPELAPLIQQTEGQLC